MPSAAGIADFAVAGLGVLGTSAGSGGGAAIDSDVVTGDWIVVGGSIGDTGGDCGPGDLGPLRASPWPGSGGLRSSDGLRRFGSLSSQSFASASSTSWRGVAYFWRERVTSSARMRAA